MNSPDGYGLYTPNDASVEGDMATSGTWRVLVGGNRALLLESQALLAGNVVHGHSANGVFDGAQAATIGGGGYNDGFTFNENEIYDDFSTIAGGEANRAGSPDGDSTTATHTTIGGGGYNDARAQFATIAGGGPTDTDNPNTTNNVVSDNYGTIGGGGNNKAGSADGDPTTARFATVGGGVGNMASEGRATVGGGINNTASATQTTVAGGTGNTASGVDSTVGGGGSNTASGGASTIPGGFDNVADGQLSFAAGSSAEALHDRTFVWSDGTPFSSTGKLQFLVHAHGGVGIGSDAPQSQLHVSDSVTGPADSLSNHVATVENTSSNGDGDGLAIKLNDPDPDENQNFVTFFDADTVVGRIEDTGGGVNYASGFGNLAEYFPKTDPEATFAPGDVVGLRDGAVVSSVAEGDATFVVSTAPMVTGNTPPAGETDCYVRLALLGQVPVAVSSPVNPGDTLVASSADDGTAVAREALEENQPERPVIGIALDESAGHDDTVGALVGTGGQSDHAGPAERSRRLQASEAENERTRADLDTKDERIDELGAETDDLREEIERKDERIERLEKRLAALEEQVGTAHVFPADD